MIYDPWSMHMMIYDVHAEFKVRDAKAQQAADFFITLEHSHAVTRTV